MKAKTPEHFKMIFLLKIIEKLYRVYPRKQDELESVRKKQEELECPKKNRMWSSVRKKQDEYSPINKLCKRTSCQVFVPRAP